VATWLLVGASVSLPSAPAHAWNREGHMVTGAIAYAVLEAQDPQALAAVLALLRQHPHASDLLEAPASWNLDRADADLALLMRAARWADDVRSGRWESHSRSNWHYVNYHYQDGHLNPPGRPDNDGYLLQELANQHRALRSNTDDATRAEALTWIFHLVGDAHQPLHAISYHAPAHPDGDRGGNRFYVRVGRQTDTINLHALWDGLVIGTGDFRSVSQRAIELRAESTLELLTPVRDDLDFAAWIATSARIAVDSVYRQGQLVSGTADQGALLPTGYLDEVQTIARERAVLAGHRLAALLAAAF
jgi:hypothetical protein